MHVLRKIIQIKKIYSDGLKIIRYNIYKMKKLLTLVEMMKKENKISRLKLIYFTAMTFLEFSYVSIIEVHIHSSTPYI